MEQRAAMKIQTTNDDGMHGIYNPGTAARVA